MNINQDFTYYNILRKQKVKNNGTLPESSNNLQRKIKSISLNYSRVNGTVQTEIYSYKTACSRLAASL